MVQDIDGNRISNGSLVRLLKTEDHWFDYEPKDAYKELQAAVKAPLVIDYIEENGRVTLVLPATKDRLGEWNTNSICVNNDEVRLVK